MQRLDDGADPLLHRASPSDLGNTEQRLRHPADMLPCVSAQRTAPEVGMPMSRQHRGRMLPWRHIRDGLCDACTVTHRQEAPCQHHLSAGVAQGGKWNAKAMNSR